MTRELLEERIADLESQKAALIGTVKDLQGLVVMLCGNEPLMNRLLRTLQQERDADLHRANGGGNCGHAARPTRTEHHP